MAKWLGLALALVLAYVGYLLLKNQSFTPPWAMPKTAKISKGDIKVPITASGLISAYQTVEIKSEASGEVIDVLVEEGKFVKKGDVLVQLKEVDEQRNVDRAQSQLEVLRAQLEQTQISILTADANILSAEAEIDRLSAEIEMSQFQLEKVERLAKQGNTNEEEMITAKSRHRANQALKKAAEARRKNATNARSDAEAAVRAQEANVRSAQTNLADAKERLSKTKITAKQDGIVTEVTIRKGMLVQSGTGGFSLGTVLLRLADVSKKKVVTRVDEADYGRVMRISPLSAMPEMPGLREAAEDASSTAAEELATRTGKVRLTVDAFPDRKFEGLIERVEPQGKLALGSSVIQFDVHVQISDPQWYILPLGAQAQVEFTVEAATGVLRVPSDAVKSSEEKKGVWLKVDPPSGSNEKWGKKFVAARFGITDGEFTELLETLGETPLKVDDEVYTKLPPEDKKES